MIDFTDCKGLVNSYEGADFKRKIIYDGDVYMLKFGQKLESDERKPMQASYASTPVSEYLGSHIYALAGLPTQHTMLGTCNGKTVVACRDFIESRPDAEDVTLVEFKKLENSFLGSSTAGGRTPSLDNLPDLLSRCYHIKPQYHQDRLVSIHMTSALWSQRLRFSLSALRCSRSARRRANSAWMRRSRSIPAM